VLSWTTTGGTTVTVNGPGVATIEVSGSLPICPAAPSPTWSRCTARRGEYTYTVTAVGDNGDVVSASATLTIV
jgi:hypothetical protein